METYQKHIQVLESECDYHQRMFLSDFMRQAQQIGSDHLLEVGIDYNRMLRDGMIFMVNKLLITIQRRPTFGERLVLTTVPKQAKGAQFIRDTYFETEAGEKLAEVSISWMLINPETRKIMRPAAFDVYGFEMFPNDGEYITRYRVKRPEAPGTLHLRQVKFTDLDYNRHVNNTVYADMVCDLLPVDCLLTREPKRFGIMFEKEATLGQVLEIETIPLPDADGFYVGGRVADSRCFEVELVFA